MILYFKITISKLQNWSRKVDLETPPCFKNSARRYMNPTAVLIIPEGECYQASWVLREEIPATLVRKPFSTSVYVLSFPEEVQDEHLDMKHDSSVRDIFQERSVAQWPSVFSCHSPPPTIVSLGFQHLSKSNQKTETGWMWRVTRSSLTNTLLPATQMQSHELGWWNDEYQWSRNVSWFNKL